MPNASPPTRPRIKHVVYALIHSVDGTSASLPAWSADTHERISAWSARVDLFIMVLIILSVIGVILESVETIRTTYSTALTIFEVFAVVVFSIEYAGRLWTCTLSERFANSATGRLRWALTPMALVDLLAVLPFYLPFLGVDARFLRILRLMRILRLAKLRRYLSTMRLFGNVWIAKKHEIIMTTALMLMMLLISSSLMYYAERGYQPETFGSIPQSMWWAVATLTTVGYGDVTPISGLGRSMAAVVAMIGIGLFALPTSILGSGFIEEIEKDRKARAQENMEKQAGGPHIRPDTTSNCTCPHCGNTFTVALQPMSSSEPGASSP